MPPPASTRAWRGCRFGSVRIGSPVGISARRPADLKMVLPQRRAAVECSEMLGRSGLLGLAVAGLAWAAAAPVEVEVRGVRLDPTTGSPVVQLVEKGKGARELPIWIGPFEAQAIAAFFKAAEAKGVLVSDVGDDSAAHEALRGDVITALDGEPVHSVVELADRAGAHAASKPVRLSLRRGARELTISFPAR